MSFYLLESGTDRLLMESGSLLLVDEVIAAAGSAAATSATSGAVGVVAAAATAAAAAGTVSFVSSATGTSTTTITKPTGLSVGDVLIVAAVDNVSGLSLSGSTFINLGQTTIASTNVLHLFCRVIDGTESSTFTASAATNYEAIAYRGVAGLPSIVNGWGASGGSTITSRYRAPVDGTVVHIFAASGTGSPTVVTPGSPTNDRGGFTVRTFWGLNISDESVAAGDDNNRAASITTGSGLSEVSKALILPSSLSVPTVVGSSTGSGNSTNATLAIPSDALVGDLFLCAFQVTGAVSITAGATGFTAIDGPGFNTGGGQRSNYWWGWKILASGEPGSTISITSGSQVWGSAGVVVRNPNPTTPLAGSGTMTNGTGSTATLVALANSSGVGLLAVSALMMSAGSGSGGHVISVATIQGLAWNADTTVSSGWGAVGLAVQGVPNGASSLAPTVAIASTPTWETDTVLLGSSPSAVSTPAVSATSGTVTAVEAASGTVAAVSATTGAPSAPPGAAAGTSAAVSATSGTATALDVASGTVAGVSATTGTVSSLLLAAGTTAAVSTETGTVTSSLVAAGTVAGVSATSGAVTVVSSSTAYAAAGTVAAASATTGAVTSRLGAAGTVAGTSATTGAVTARLAAAGIDTAVATVSGLVTASLQASGVAAAVSATSGEAHTPFRDIDIVAFEDASRDLVPLDVSREVVIVEVPRELTLTDWSTT